MKRIFIITAAAGALALGGMALFQFGAEAGSRNHGQGAGGAWDAEGGWRQSLGAMHGGRRWGMHRWGGHRWGRRKGMHRMLKRMDLDGDKKLTQEEVTRARTAMLTKHDANSDGKLSLDEFGKLWAEVRNHRMVRGFQRLDDDGDASVTLAEFMGPFENVVERLDRNDDGVLDRSDRRMRRGDRGRRGRHLRGGGDALEAPAGEAQ